MLKTDVEISVRHYVILVLSLSLCVCMLNTCSYTHINTNLFQVILSENSGVVLVDVLLLPVLAEERILD